ncbi:MAG: sialate O-acetylesterase [Phenylobacterium sp.]|uniref:sialate O-acetylesterase n=1 Tax=Phenylobacterium sp. TaxID=1871053 RepID=UPI002732A1CF|nr:sialate O-acetylesterase [Phenylobacterium sp.]MDP3749254.1 sialate O-acetylesterase [Phenylobacterium sp.]
MSTLVVIAGQSNALGFQLGYSDLPSYAQTPDPGVKIWNGSAFVTMEPSVNTGSPGDLDAWGPEVEFAYQWRQDHPGETLYVVKYARGSTGLANDPSQSDWSPASGELFAAAKAQVDAAKAALSATGQGYKVGAIIWMQGETDATDLAKANAYQANLTNLFAQMRAQWGDADTSIYFGQISTQSNFAYEGTVQLAEANVDSADANAFMTITDAFAMQSDLVHFSGSGQVSLGGGLYANYDTAVSVTGGSGADTLIGRGGLDSLFGGDGADKLVGGDAYDYLHGNQGNDLASGGNGDDWVLGGQGADTVSGEAGNDLVRGDAGNDTVYGNFGNDTVEGGVGDDTVRGGQGDDVVSGGDGADWLAGDRGADTVTGGIGADTFYGTAGIGVDRITDFSLADGDRIQLSPGTAYTLSYQGSDTIIDLGGGDVITLAGAQPPAGSWIFYG